MLLKTCNPDVNQRGGLLVDQHPTKVQTRVQFLVDAWKRLCVTYVFPRFLSVLIGHVS
jgi:hypothetical protein